jgi:hypothetical protein
MAVKFSGCMRSHGVSDFPDPTIGSNGLPSWASSTTRPPPAYNAARLVCKHELPNIGPQTSAERATANGAALKYATCMRSNGVPSFPDPNGQGLIQINAAGTLDPGSPQFGKAETTCESLDNGFGSATAVPSTSDGAGGGS